MVFQFSKTRAKKAEVKDRPKERAVSDALNEPPVSGMYVQGRKATAPEWRVAQALNRRGIKYDFQKNVLGGRNPGGSVLDFYLYTAPLPTPMNVQGEYWHRLSRSYEDKLKEAQVNEMFGKATNRMVLVWERDLGSVDEAEVELGKKGIW